MNMCALKNKRGLSGEGLRALPKDRADKPSPATRLFFNPVILFFSLMGMICFSTSTFAKVVNKVVAVVNNDVITEYDLNKTMASPSFGKKTRRQVLEDLIDQALLKQEMEKTDIEVTDDDLARAIAGVLDRNKINIEILRAELASKGIAFEAYKEQLKQQIKQTKFVQQNVGSNVSVQDADVTAYKFERAEIVNPSGTVHIGWIFYPLDDDHSEKEIKKVFIKARKVADKARQKGADFKKLSPETGDLGEKSLSDLPPAISSEVRRMEIGEVSDPIVSPQGVYVVKLYEKALQNISEKEKVDDMQIRQTIYNDRMEQEIHNYALKLRRKAFIDIKE